MAIHIGIGRADITPPVGVPLVGYAGRGDSIGVNDRLSVTVLAASENEETVLIVDCDLLGICDDITAELRDEIEVKTGVPADAVMVACTHTHYGPNLYSRDERPDVAAYQSLLKYLVAGAAADAMRNRQEAVTAVGYGESHIGTNRREKTADGSIRLGNNPNGPIDRSVGVWRVDSVDGQPIVTLVNFATHPVSQGSKTRTISADYPGKTRHVVERLTGGPCMFLQGACGNINAILKDQSYEPARTLGTRLGCEVVRVWESISPVNVSGINRVAKNIALPRYRYLSLDNAERIASDLKRDLERLKDQGGDPGEIYWAESRLGNIEKAMESWESGVPDEAIDAEIGALRIGDLSFVSVPGEIFCQIGTQVKSSSPNTFFTGYSGGTIGYVPVPEAYQQGGYEVTHACKVDPDAAGMIIDTSLELLEALNGG